MSIVDRMIEWREVAEQGGTTLDRITLFPWEYREMVARLTGEFCTTKVEPGFKGFFMDTPLYVREPIKTQWLNDPRQMAGAMA